MRIEDKMLNGSVHLPADATRKVIAEAEEELVEHLTGLIRTVRTEVSELRSDMHKMEARLNMRIDTAEENTQAQFAQQKRKICMS